MACRSLDTPHGMDVVQACTVSACVQGLWLQLKCFLAAEAHRDAATACHVAPLLETCNARLAEVGQGLVASRCVKSTTHAAASMLFNCIHLCAESDRTMYVPAGMEGKTVKSV